MRNGVLTIMKKELARFFGDKRMVVSILMPGVLIYIMYAFMGNAMGSAFGMDEDYTPAIQAVSLPGSMEALLPQTGFSLITGTEQRNQHCVSGGKPLPEPYGCGEPFHRAGAEKSRVY